MKKPLLHVSAPISRNGASLPARPEDEKQRLAEARGSFNTRRIPREALARLSRDGAPRAGDLVLARVTRLAQHGRLHLRGGRPASMQLGDEILVCYGDRYAPNQFEAYIPEDLSPCHLVASGGVASLVASRHGSMKSPTEIEPIGLVTDEHGERINLARYRLPAQEWRSTPVIAVLGTSMDSGKTTTACAVIRGMRLAGKRVSAGKVTGTGSGRDFFKMVDSGAKPVLDFVDAGHATTFRIGAEAVEAAFDTLTSNLAASGPDAIVIEIADGLLQAETAELVRSQIFRQRVSAVLFAATDAMGAGAGVSWLQKHGLPVVGISGPISQSRLAVSEANAVSSVPVHSIEDLHETEIAHRLAASKVGIAS